MDEENLIQALKGGDMTAIDEIYRAYSIPALRTAYLMTSERHTAEDVLQDTFIQCIKSINSLKNNAAFKPWFYKILIRNAYKAVKAQKNTIPAQDIYDRADTAVYDSYPSESGELLNCINTLKPKLRSTVILFYYNDLSIKEISQIMQCPQGTVKSRLNTAKKELKKIIEKEKLL
ncbi:MAG: RNA polymerase sigma factor [Firmicutes bacterium]|nr:RNA polymerase sigma factor [Bacillota bacterium]